MADKWESDKLVDFMITRSERKIGVAFVLAIEKMQAHHAIDDLVALLNAGQIDEALAMTSRYAGQLASVVNNAYIGAGQAAVDELGDTLGIIVNFDQTNLRAVRAMAENRLELVRGFTAGQRQATHQALVRGVREGANPREMARAFRDSIGLTGKQEEWIANYKRELQGLDSNAYRRKLRDARSDKAVKRAIREGKPLPADQIEKMVGRYRKRWINYRAETIARTEALDAVHAGTDEAIAQGIESGEIDPSKARAFWNTATDERVRDPSIGADTSHRTMHLQERAIDEPFVSGAGNLLMRPGDPNAPANERIKCRCRKSIRVAI